MPLSLRPLPTEASSFEGRGIGLQRCSEEARPKRDIALDTLCAHRVRRSEIVGQGGGPSDERMASVDFVLMLVASWYKVTIVESHSQVVVGERGLRRRCASSACGLLTIVFHWYLTSSRLF